MFTGIVEDVGRIVRVRPQGKGARVVIQTSIPLDEVKLGDSIACNGACLTAEAFDGDTFEVVAGAETLQRTTAGSWKEGDALHLERALALGGRLDGHLVQGHVDGVGKVVRTKQDAESWLMWIELPNAIARYAVEKGSLCVDGVSLTINSVEGRVVRLNIVPHTAEVTLLGKRRAGDAVNLEVDLIAKYVERLLTYRAPTSGGLTLDTLKKHGFA